MMRFVKMYKMIAACAALPLLTSPSNAQDNKLPAPIPVQISTATRVFVSNAMDMNYEQAARTYNSFYGGLKSWGKYSLVATPAEADLIFEVRVFGSVCGETTPTGACTQITLNLHILDRATHAVLWSINEPWGGTGLTEGEREKASASSVDQVIEDLYVLATPSATASLKKPHVSPSLVDGASPKK